MAEVVGEREEKISGHTEVLAPILKPTKLGGGEFKSCLLGSGQARAAQNPFLPTWWLTNIQSTRRARERRKAPLYGRRRGKGEFQNGNGPWVLGGQSTGFFSSHPGVKTPERINHLAPSVSGSYLSLNIKLLQTRGKVTQSAAASLRAALGRLQQEELGGTSAF